MKKKLWLIPTVLVLLSILAVSVGAITPGYLEVIFDQKGVEYSFGPFPGDMDGQAACYMQVPDAENDLDKRSGLSWRQLRSARMTDYSGAQSLKLFQVDPKFCTPPGAAAGSSNPENQPPGLPAGPDSFALPERPWVAPTLVMFSLAGSILTILLARKFSHRLVK